MATKWQESCIRALCTSPVHYELFKKKQYNQRMMKQFEARLFPFYVKEEKNYKKEKGTVVNPFRKFFKEILESQINAHGDLNLGIYPEDVEITISHNLLQRELGKFDSTQDLMDKLYIPNYF